MAVMYKVGQFEIKWPLLNSDNVFSQQISPNLTNVHSHVFEAPRSLHKFIGRK